MVDNVTAMIELRWVLGLAPFGPGYGLVAAVTVGCFGVTGIAARAVLGETLPALAVALAIGLAAFAAALYFCPSVAGSSPRWSAALRTRAGAAAASGPGRASSLGKVTCISGPRTRESRVGCMMTQQARGPVNRATRQAAKQVLRQYGEATVGLRRGPDFVIIGAKRGGTTSLYNYLLEHPSIHPLFPGRQHIKGVHYYDSNYARGLRWYRSHFPLEASGRHIVRPGLRPGHRRRGEPLLPVPPARGRAACPRFP